MHAQDKILMETLSFGALPFYFSSPVPDTSEKLLLKHATSISLFLNIFIIADNITAVNNLYLPQTAMKMSTLNAKDFLIFYDFAECTKQTFFFVHF